jgi:hypothetical protein
MSISNGQFTRTNSFAPGAERNYPRFFVDSVQDQLASANAGRPIFRDEERVEIIMPGNPYTRPVQRVTDTHREKWPKEYAAFKAGLELSAEGTPLEEWPRLKRSQVLELKALGFQTVEHVARMDDQATQRVGIGGAQLRELAKAFLDDAAHAAEVERLADANTRKDEELDALRRQVNELGRTLEAMHAELMAARQSAPEAIRTEQVPGERGIAAPAAASSLDGLLRSPRPRANRKANTAGAADQPQ